MKKTLILLLSMIVINSSFAQNVMDFFFEPGESYILQNEKGLSRRYEFYYWARKPTLDIYQIDSHRIYCSDVEKLTITDNTIIIDEVIKAYAGVGSAKSAPNLNITKLKLPQNGKTEVWDKGYYSSSLVVLEIYYNGGKRHIETIKMAYGSGKGNDKQIEYWAKNLGLIYIKDFYSSTPYYSKLLDTKQIKELPYYEISPENTIPSKVYIKKREQARQDSLEQIRRREEQEQARMAAKQDRLKNDSLDRACREFFNKWERQDAELLQALKQGKPDGMKGKQYRMKRNQWTWTRREIRRLNPLSEFNQYNNSYAYQQVENIKVYWNDKSTDTKEYYMQWLQEEKWRSEGFIERNRIRLEQIQQTIKYWEQKEQAFLEKEQMKQERKEQRKRK